MLRAVIFDFDGVITDSEILHLRAFNKVLSQFGVEINKKEYYTRYLGFTDSDCFNQLISDGLLKTNKSRIPELRKQKNQVFEELAKNDGKTIEGVKEFLDLLSQNQIPSAICSGALQTEIEMILEEAKLRHFFVTIVSAEQVRRGKPHPEGFLLTLKKLNQEFRYPISAEECVVIEDSIWGLHAAGSAGMHSIAVTNSYDAEQLNMAEKIVSNLNEITMEDLHLLCS
jgi:beta-phosphoglucomutase